MARHVHGDHRRRDDGPELRLVPDGRHPDPVRLGRHPEAVRPRRATARSPARSSPAAMPSSRGSTATRHGADPGGLRFLNQLSRPPRRASWSSPASTVMVTESSRKRNSTRSSAPPTARIWASCRSPISRRRSLRLSGPVARRSAQQGNLDPRALPPGDRLASARPEARRVRARLHAQDQRRQGRGHALEADRPASRSSSSSAISRAARSAARRGTSRSSITATRTAPHS